VNKIWVVARREYLATVRTKAFLIGVIMMPVFMLLGGVIGAINRRFEDQGEKRFAVVDRTPGEKLFPLLEAAAKKRNETEITDKKTQQRTAPAFVLEKVAPEADIDELRLRLSDRVRKGELAGFLEIGPKALDSSLFGGLLGKGKDGLDKPDDQADDLRTTRYQTRPTATGAMSFYQWALREIPWAQLELSLSKTPGGDRIKAMVRRSMTEQRAPVVMLDLSSRDPRTGKVQAEEGVGKSVVQIFVGIGCIMLMFVIIFAVATPMMQGVLEEKMQRISEVLLGSLSPFQLMAGKLLGGVGVALTLGAVYVAGAYWALHHFGYADQVPAWMIVWFVIYLTMALLMYGSMFLAVGAACTDMKEPQTLMLPVMLPAMLPLFLIAPILSNPDGTLARVASFFPPCTPMLMLARLALSANIGWWEPILGTLLVLAFTLLCVWIAGRIFRVGILVQGKGATLAEMATWVFRT
jgi:ABC-type Na+ efflux pump permease subunit